MRITVKVFLVLLLTLLSCVTFVACSGDDVGESDSFSREPCPWENGGKQPFEYTWEEFEALSAGQQFAFQNSFGSIEEFDKWCNSVNPEEPESKIFLPWENAGKQPSEYTWEEFEALEGGQQIAFQYSFESEEAFYKWFDRVNTEESESKAILPWENGGKQPSEYTWAEFEALEGGLQIAFQDSFGSIEGFDKWLQKVKPEESEEQNEISLPWENGGKQPSDYTWEEFEALEGGLQIAFQDSFDSMEEFDEWLQRVNPQ